MTRSRRWPLIVIAAPAAVAVWSGWVGLGAKCGFGLVQPLPGIVPWHLDTAITLPVGVEAYGAYALGTWLTPGTPGRARTFARRSAIGALALGVCGQVAFHLLSGVPRAPWLVVVFVSCLPVVTLGFGAALYHLKHAPEPAAEPAGQAAPEPAPAPVAAVPETAGPPAAPAGKRPAAARRKPAPRPAARVPQDVDAQAEALAILAADPGIKGAELGRRVGRSERWGQDLKKKLAVKEVRS